MTPSQHQAILNRSLELERGIDPDYKPVDIHYLASLDVGSVSKTLHTLRDLETAAWAKAEYCLVRDVGRLLNGDGSLLDKWSANVVPEDPSQLQTKAQLLCFLARIIRDNFLAEVAEPELSAASL
jgi:hypothetical protein